MSFGIGASLASMGQEQQQQATAELKRSADEESKRNAENKMLEAQDKAGKKQLGATLGSAAGFYAGAQAGSSFGPWGALIGGAVGYLAGDLF